MPKFILSKENTCMPNNQLVSQALDMLTKMYSCGRANESQTTLLMVRNN